MTRAAWAAVAVLLAGPAVAAVDRGAHIPLATPAAASAWWTAFDDSLLSGLMPRAGAAPAAQLAVAQTYVAQRVAQAREKLAGQLQQAATEQRAWLEQAAGSAEERSRWLAALDARRQHWAGVQQLMVDERERAEATLAALTRSERPALQALLAPTEADDDDSRLPQVRLQVPTRLTVADHADAAAPLQKLQAAQAQAQRAQSLLQASELELRSRQLRQQAGADTPLGVLESYQRLLADADRLAALSGAVAVAWAQWLQATDGQAVAAVTDTGRVLRAR